MKDLKPYHMPIVEAIIRHTRKNPLPMHVPGHKMGRGFPRPLDSWLSNALQIDLTELEGLDDLHHPTGPIREAQMLAAQAFGADATFFLVNGSTSGNYAMLFATCKPRDRVIVARNSHKSVLQAIMMRNLRPVFFDLPIDPFTMTAGPVPIDTVRQAIERYPDAKAICITSPTYQGFFSPIAEIADCAHRAGMLLLVDEAHGAHLTFHSELKRHAALSQGADLVVQSTHKMLGSLTQTAMLHLKGSRVDPHRVQQYVSYFQSSSPSYLFLAALDAARSQMATDGGRLLAESLDRWKELYKVAATWEYIEVADYDVSVRDPFKICLRFTGRSTGDIQTWLQDHHQIQLELVTPSHALAVATYADTEGMVKRFIHSLDGLNQWLKEDFEIKFEAEYASEEFAAILRKQQDTSWLLTEPAIEYEQLDRMETEWVPLEQAQGRIAKTALIPYPPGIPVICPGEQIGAWHLQTIREHIKNNGNVQGLHRKDMDQVAVVKEYKL